ncbi:Aromatic amino acid beta-eliminating lyase/threonine aldolase [Penicillium maclennaniae]|uniref:Aromatic amino acid beta-eliminating lyase/threonine aldolase n=1 Tax=Penicillium maclennaniae TaxID=1343394 RepID=UPI00253F7681|nr:Aromatic amino acid beta-eliminating lyase/threonine aldolase [Penicillium maclennaniae]KAJ5675240.1 Aromatic amino acid beta-eliminating lyase/threonine aldolase [Penicillium maclennaniae]
MNRSLRYLSRPLTAARSFTPLSSVYLTRNFPRAYLNTGAMAQNSATNGKPNTWQGAGAAEFDLRSMTFLWIKFFLFLMFTILGDTMTKPTPSMLDAICQTTLLDDVFNEDPTTNTLQNYVAERTQHEAALLVLSGTMGNQVAIRSHLTQPPYAVLCDHRSHIICYEAGGVSAWTGATVQTVSGEHLDGMIMPLAEARRIVEWAHENDIKVHLDGARLWQAVVSGAGSLSEYASIFDSVSLCFSKGLGAPIGSIIVGSQAFIKKARWFRKSIGGGARQTGVFAAAARVALDETFGTDDHGQTGKLSATHTMAKRVEELWTRHGGKLQYPVHTNMVWLDLEASGVGPNDLSVIGKEKGLTLLGNRIVIHYQVSDEAIARLEQVFDIAMKGQYQRSDDTSRAYGSKQT